MRISTLYHTLTSWSEESQKQDQLLHIMAQLSDEAHGPPVLIFVLNNIFVAFVNDILGLYVCIVGQSTCWSGLHQGT